MAILAKTWGIFLEDGLSRKGNKEEEWKERGRGREKETESKNFIKWQQTNEAFEPPCLALPEAR